MQVEKLRRCLLLQAVPGLSSRRLAQLLAHLGSVDALWHSNPADWPGSPLPADTLRAFEQVRQTDSAARSGVDVDKQMALLEQVDARVIDLTSGDYPPLLAAIPDPPPVLYLRGNSDVLLHPQLAIVGSRNASSAGLRAARDLAGAAAEAGLVVTSGLALGIDGAAHEGALRVGGASVAVMATGVEQVYPCRHRPLAEQLLAEEGCLVSEFPPGSGPRREHFPRRNRVISGLSLGVLVVEAALPSGSLITAHTAAEQGREVFALPWSIFHPGGRGCLSLLRDGASLVLDLDDLWYELEALVGVQRALTLPAQAGAEPELPPESSLLQWLGDSAMGVDELVSCSGRTAMDVMTELSTLELAGKVTREAGGYARCWD